MISHLKVSVLTQQEVLRLQVAVGNRHLVEILQREDHAPAEERRHVEGKPSEARLGDGRVPLVDVRPSIESASARVNGRRQARAIQYLGFSVLRGEGGGKRVSSFPS